MKYKIYNCNSFNVYTIKTDKFKTSHIEVIFQNAIDKKMVSSYSFLADILSESSKNYPTKKDLMIKYEQLYKMIIYAFTTRVGNVLNFNISLDFINPSYIESKTYVDDVLKTFFDVIDNPNVNNDEFDQKAFNIVKMRLKKEISSLKDNHFKLSLRKALQEACPDTASSLEILGSLESLEKITPSNLYKAYKDLRKNFKVDIFIIGNLDMDKIVFLIKKYFKHRFINQNSYPFMIDNKKRNKPIIKKDVSQNIQANLVMVYNLTDLTELEKNVTFIVFNYLFASGGLTSKLYKTVREKYSLCYAINSMYLKYDKLLVLHISLENENIKKAISLVKKELQNMQKGDFTLDELNDAINNMLISLDMSNDNSVSILNNYVFYEYDKLPLPDERKELFENLSKDDIINVSKKIKLNTIFTLEGKNK